MYAILKHGGHQYRVSSGDRLVVDRLPAEVGAVVGLAPVLLIADGDSIQADGGGLEGVRVAATVLGHRRGTKLRVFTYKPKKRHRRTLGFRAELTELLVDRVLAAGEALPTPDAAEVPAPAAAGAAPESEAPVPAPSRGRRRRPAALPEAAAGETVAEAWGEAQPSPPAEPAREAPVEDTVPPAEGGVEADVPPRRRRPRASTPAAVPASEEKPTSQAEGSPPTRARRRRVAPRDESGGDEAE
jgi:large subunit ribosomal protein L21